VNKDVCVKVKTLGRVAENIDIILYNPNFITPIFTKTSPLRNLAMSWGSFGLSTISTCRGAWLRKSVFVVLMELSS